MNVTEARAYFDAQFGNAGSDVLDAIIAEAVAEVTAALISARLSGSADWHLYVLAGAPVDYTDGDPPATGQAEAGIGSLAINQTDGKVYSNTGTKAQPIWTLVGTQA